MWLHHTPRWWPLSTTLNPRLLLDPSRCATTTSNNLVLHQLHERLALGGFDANCLCKDGS